jgi:hypothetical protein
MKLFAILVSSLFLAGCVGEAAVRYHGSVVSSPQPGWSFDAQPNPSSAPPIPGAEVRMCICHEPCPCAGPGGSKVSTDASGRYEVPEMMFPGMIGVETHIVVRAAAPGFEPSTYSLNFDKQTSESRKNEPTFGQKALNFRLKPAASPPAATPGAPPSAPANPGR